LDKAILGDYLTKELTYLAQAQATLKSFGFIPVALSAAP
jgi:hypothetical protein